MRMKWISGVLIVGLLLAVVGGVAAQTPSVEWQAWNAQITAHANSSQLDVAETQIIMVRGGPLHSGIRDYSQPVQIQNVFFALNGQQPQELPVGSGPGTYQVSNANGGVTLQYQLPNPANTGDTFAVQINYVATEPTPGVIDWFVVPGDHVATVDSSTLTINFPDGQAPDPSFVRMTEGNGTVSVQGNSIVIQSQGAIPANQAFGVQLPYGANVGTGGNPSQPVPAQPAPNNDTGLGISGILGLLCIVGLLVLFGGGNLLRNLLGGGSVNRPGGGFFGGGTPYNPPSNQPGGFGNTPTSGRGFRESPNQNREVPTIQGDKRRGGGASFK